MKDKKIAAKHIHTDTQKKVAVNKPFDNRVKKSIKNQILHQVKSRKLKSFNVYQKIAEKKSKIFKD